MDSKLGSYYEQAKALLNTLSTEDGYMASAVSSDNYQRVWARDSIICGIAGLLTKEKNLILGLKNSLLTLARHQHELGMIPSNVLEMKDKADVSFGSLVGRVDSNCWFIIGACLYYNSENDGAAWAKLGPVVEKCLRFLKSVEFNGRGWLYTPLSGNWADEYPIQGYTLYDNALYYWARNCYSKINPENEINLQAIKRNCLANYWPTEGTEDNLKHHKEAFNEAVKRKQQHFCSYLLPGKYDMRFDCAGHGIALLNWKLSLDQKEGLTKFILNLKNEINVTLPPAFWPVITETECDWEFLRHNYSYSFKNYPYQFHNGGIWPVWLGWLCLGLTFQGLQDISAIIAKDLIDLLPESDWNFNEYFRSDTLEPAGKVQMGFSASGIIFMKIALDSNFDKSILML